MVRHLVKNDLDVLILGSRESRQDEERIGKLAHMGKDKSYVTSTYMGMWPFEDFTPAGQRASEGPMSDATLVLSVERQGVLL